MVTLVKWKSYHTFFPPTFVYWNASGSLSHNIASILETEKSRSLMTCKLDKEMYWKMLVAAVFQGLALWG